MLFFFFLFFFLEMWLIVPKLTLLPLLLWSTDFNIVSIKNLAKQSDCISIKKERLIFNYSPTRTHTFLMLIKH